MKYVCSFTIINLTSEFNVSFETLFKKLIELNLISKNGLATSFAEDQYYGRNKKTEPFFNINCIEFIHEKIKNDIEFQIERILVKTNKMVIFSTNDGTNKSQFNLRLSKLYKKQVESIYDENKSNPIFLKTLLINIERNNMKSSFETFNFYNELFTFHEMNKLDLLLNKQDNSKLNKLPKI